MKHNVKGIKEKRILIAEEVIKTAISKGNIPYAIEVAEKNKIDSKRFGELTAIAEAQA